VGLLAQIKADVMDRAVPLSSLLQQCIMLGLDTGSEKMRDWARQELNGYTEVDTLPEYRRIPVPLMAMITNMAGYKGRSTRIGAVSAVRSPSRTSRCSGEARSATRTATIPAPARPAGHPSGTAAAVAGNDTAGYKGTRDSGDQKGRQQPLLLPGVPPENPQPRANLPACRTGAL
jgi:hypothetical protein